MNGHHEVREFVFPARASDTIAFDGVEFVPTAGLGLVEGLQEVPPQGVGGGKDDGGGTADGPLDSYTSGGDGGILGQAGPTAVRSGTYLPATAIMRFETADAASLFEAGEWDAMIHSIGFGTIWQALGLTTGSIASGDLRFTGANALDFYESDFTALFEADAETAAGVPVETDGGPGTAGGHRDEAYFGPELMTGHLEAGAGPEDHSMMSIASLEDIGYDTIMDDPSDPFGLNGLLA